jgi:hypothetical protein
MSTQETQKLKQKVEAQQQRLTGTKLRLRNLLRKEQSADNCRDKKLEGRKIQLVGKWATNHFSQQELIFNLDKFLQNNDERTLFGLQPILCNATNGAPPEHGHTL